MFYGIYENKEKANEFEVVYQKGSNFFKKKINTKPYFFVPVNDNGEEKTIYKDMYNNSVRKVTFDNIFEQRANLKRLKDKNLDFCGDLQQKYQALISFYNIVTNKNNSNIFNIEKGENFIAWNYDIEAFSLKTDDFIKPEDATAPVQSICIQDMSENKYYVFGYFDYEVTDIHRKDIKDDNILFTVKKEDIIYIKCGSEQELLKKFVNIVETKVNLLTGYNIDLYDNLYIANRLKKLGICYEFVNKLNLSRGVTRFGKIQTVDLYESIKKFKAPKTENNKLETIAKFYLGYGKVEFEGSYRDLYKNDYKKFIDYNIIDVALVYQLEKKLGVIKLMVNLANKFLCNIEDTMSLTTYVDNAIYSKALLNKKVIVQGKKSVVKEPYVGGYVLEPKRGLSGLSICADVESSYPTNIRIYNISPEKLVKYTDLSSKLFRMVLELKFKFAKELYLENIGVCRNKNGDILKTKNPQTEYQLVHFFPNDKIVKNNDQLFYLSYPRMLIGYGDSIGEIDYKTFNCKDAVVSSISAKDNKNTIYFFYINNKEGLENLLNKYPDKIKFNENLFCFYEQLITEKLIEYFVNDKDNFIPFKPYLKKYNYTMTPNLQFFKIDSIGLIPEFVEETFFDRVKFKKLTEDYGLLIEYVKTKDLSILSKITFKDEIEEYLGLSKDGLYNLNNSVKDLEILKELADLDNNTLKVVINGTYGFLAFEGSRYYNKDLGEAITSAGQLTASGCRKYIVNEFPNELEQIYQDTDSNIFAFKQGSKVMSKIDESTSNKEKVEIILDFYNNTILPKINEYFDFLKVTCNRRDVKVKFDLETIMSDTFFTDMKKYCWKLIYKSGNIYEKGKEKYKHTGLSYIKSSCPVWVKPKLKKLTELLIETKADSKFLNAYILKCKQAFKKANIIDICSSTAIQTLYNYTKESDSIPAGVDASLNYNEYLDKKNLKQFAKLTNKDKVAWIYLDKNKYGFDKIVITKDLEEYILNDFVIDYEKQFESTFMGLIERYFEVCDIEFYNKKSKKLF